jgi:hypothetical protein
MNKELKQLQRVQDRANQIHNVWTGNYLPCELQTLAEIDAVPKLIVAVGTISASGLNTTTQAYAQATHDIAEAGTEMCYSDACGTTNRMSVARAKSQSWRIQGDLRYEETRVDSQNAQRLNDRITMINPGRNGLANALNAMGAASAIYASVAEQAEAAKGSDAYAKGRMINFAKDALGSVGAIAKAFASPVLPQNPTTGMDYPTMYGPETPAAEIGNMDFLLPEPVSIPTVEIPTGMDLDF